MYQIQVFSMWTFFWTSALPNLTNFFYELTWSVFLARRRMKVHILIGAFLPNLGTGEELKHLRARCLVMKSGLNHSHFSSSPWFFARCSCPSLLASSINCTLIYSKIFIEHLLDYISKPLDYISKHNRSPCPYGAPMSPRKTGKK